MAKHRRSWKSRVAAGITLGTGLSLLSFVASGDPVRLSAGMDNRFSDNMRQSPNNEESDLETRVRLKVEHQSDPGVCNSNLFGDLGYGYWYSDTFDPKTYTTVQYVGDCELADRLMWRVSDNLRDVTQDTRSTSTPDNTTRKNVFRTGPSYTLRLSAVDQIVLSADYENTEFSQPEETDSERAIGTVAWSHLFDATLSGGLTLSTNRAELDTSEEIDTDTARITFNKLWPASRVRGSVGYSSMERRLNALTRKSKAWVGDITIDRDINPSAKMYLIASRELTDQTSDFDFQFDEFGFNLRESSTVEVTAARLGVDKRFSNGANINGALFGHRSKYLDTNNTEDQVGFDVRYQRPVAVQLDAHVRSRYSYISYTENDANDDLVNLEFGLTYQASRKLSLAARVGHNRRTSDIATREYDENYAVLGLNYDIL